MPRTYEARPKATVTVQDDGTVEVSIDLVNLPSEMEQDYLAGHSDSEVASDIEEVKEAFMASPMNHFHHVTLSR
jgi:hypothetical protein